MPDEELVILIRHGPSSMKYKLWERHTSSKSPVYKLNIQQFEPLLALKNQLAALKKLNTQGYTIKVLTIKLASLLRNKKIGTYCSINPDTIYRGRIFATEEDLVSISQLWYPPIDRVTCLGRVNRKGQQIFYCASSATAVSFELDPKLNEFIGIVECKLVSDHPMIRLAQLGLDSKILARVKAPEVVQKAIEKIEKAYESNLIIDGIPIGDFSETLVAQSFFHSEFSKRVPDSDRDQYKMTIAIADLFLSDKGIDGIVYPAITTQFQNESNVVGHNAAIKKEIVDKYYRASRVWLLRCDHLTEKGYALELIKCSDEISNDGLIIWSEKIIEMPT